MTLWRSLFLVMLAGWLSGCGINNIPTYDEQVKAAWSQVENQYQRRADLIPAPLHLNGPHPQFFFARPYVGPSSPPWSSV